MSLCCMTASAFQLLVVDRGPRVLRYGRGQGDFLDGGTNIARKGGKVALNPHGGQLSAGRTHGMGFMHEAVLQLRAEAGERQVDSARVAVVSSGGLTPSGAICFAGNEAGAEVVGRFETGRDLLGTVAALVVGCLGPATRGLHKGVEKWRENSRGRWRSSPEAQPEWARP